MGSEGGALTGMKPFVLGCGYPYGDWMMVGDSDGAMGRYGDT